MRPAPQRQCRKIRSPVVSLSASPISKYRARLRRGVAGYNWKKAFQLCLCSFIRRYVIECTAVPDVAKVLVPNHPPIDSGRRLAIRRFGHDDRLLDREVTRRAENIEDRVL